VTEQICGVSVISWEFFCEPDFTSFIEIFTGNVRRSDFEFTCGLPQCEVEIQASKLNAYRVLEENQSTKVCIPCGNAAGDSAESLVISIHQLQSGGTYKEDDGLTEREFCFLRVSDFIEEMITSLGWTTGTPGSQLLSPIFTRPFLTDNREIVVPNNNDTTITVFLEYETGFQKTVTINVDATDTVADIQILIQKGILAISPYGISGGFSPQWNEFQYQPAEVAILGNGNPEIHSDHPIRALTVQGDVNGFFTINQNQAYQYGLQDLIMSVNGLNTTGRDSVCCAWAEIKDMLLKIHPVVFTNGPTNGLEIQSYGEIFNGLTGASPNNPVIDPEKGTVKGKVRSDVRFSKGIFGQQWEIENLQSCLDSWVWEGVRTNLGNAGGRTNGGLASTFDVTSITTGGVGIGVFGSATLKGEIEFSITGGGLADFTFEIWDTPNTTGNLIASGQINVLGTETLSIESIFGFNPTFCVQPTDLFYFRFVTNDVPIPTISTTVNTNIYVDIASYDEPFPEIREDTSHLSDPYVGFLDFAACDGIFENDISSRTYAGIGFGIDQQANGCHDYGEAIFLSFLNAGGTSTHPFPKSMYFDENELGIDLCFRGELSQFFYHNIPLQWPQIAYEYREYIPTDLVTNTYTQAITVTSNGTGAEPTLSNFTRNLIVDNNNIESGSDRTWEYRFEACQTLVNAIFRAQDRAVRFNNCLTNSTQIAVIRKMETRFDGQGKIAFVVEASD
jgi:hypothetical protein